MYDGDGVGDIIDAGIFRCIAVPEWICGWDGYMVGAFTFGCTVMSGLLYDWDGDNVGVRAYGCTVLSGLIYDGDGDTAGARTFKSLGVLEWVFVVTKQAPRHTIWHWLLHCWVVEIGYAMHWS